MSNYCGKTRTNYFKVADVEKLYSIISYARGAEAPIEIHFDYMRADGEKRYMFMCDSEILGFPQRNNDEECDNIDYSYDDFTKALQGILPEDEAIIITEVGSEKIRYLTGSVVVITKNDIKYDDLNDRGIELARELLNNSDWSTKNEY